MRSTTATSSCIAELARGCARPRRRCARPRATRATSIRSRLAARLAEVGACVIGTIATAALHDLEREQPVVHAHVLAALGRYLSQRLHQAVEEMRTLDA